MKFMVVFGTRPEIIKLAPVIREIEQQNHECVLVHTGQHNLNSLIHDLQLRHADYTLDVPPETAGKFKGSFIKGIFNAGIWTSRIVWHIRKLIKKEKPDILIYQGDTLAIAAACIAGRTLTNRPLLAHVEAGLRTHNLFNPFPEEIARRISGKLSDLHFCPTEEAANNLRKEIKLSDKIFVVGNTIVDAVFQHVELAKKLKMKLPGSYGVCFIHRQENVHSKQSLLNLYNLLKSVDDKIFFMEHPTTMQKLHDFHLYQKFKRLDNIIFQPLLDYLPFLKLMSRASYVITDSGGLQEESAILKVPCIVWRDTTERPEAVEAGTARLVTDYKLALELIAEIKGKRGFYREVKKSANPFGDGRASKRIVRICAEHAFRNK